MCGVVAVLDGSEEVLARGVRASLHRGPDAGGTLVRRRVALGHTRLSILDLDARSNQPFVYGRIALSYNGELWNYRELRAELKRAGKAFTTDGDTEVVAAALETWGADALPRMNGMFALAWTDGDSGTLWLARDRFGEIPLHYSPGPPFVAASELKVLRAMGARLFFDVPPGGMVVVERGGRLQRHLRWYDPPAEPIAVSAHEARLGVYERLMAGATERAISDVPVCTLLSGGIDSAAVAFHLKRELPGLVCYTAVLDKKSRDLRCAREVAEALKLELVEVQVAPPTPDDLARVVDIIEMPHKAQVEIGWACLVLAERMRADGFRVTFSGEGSDELWASYGFGYHGVQARGWHTYRKQLFLEQHRKNFARCNKVFMAHGVECRLPFLHPPLVEYALSLPAGVVREGAARPKAVLQEGFRGLLPDSVVDRPKVAFQDGMGLKDIIAKTLASPRAFYAAEFKRRYA